MFGVLIFRNCESTAKFRMEHQLLPREGGMQVTVTVSAPGGDPLVGQNRSDAHWFPTALALSGSGGERRDRGVLPILLITRLFSCLTLSLFTLPHVSHLLLKVTISVVQPPLPLFIKAAIKK